METLKQPLSLRNSIGEIFKAYLLCDYIRVFQKSAKSNTHVQIAETKNKFFVAVSELPTKKILDNIFEVRYNDGTWHKVQFISSFAKADNRSLQGATHYAKVNDLLCRIERQGVKYEYLNLIEIKLKVSKAVKEWKITKKD